MLQYSWRWHRLKSESKRKLYVVHELVSQGNRRQWVYSSALEVVRGARPA